MYIDAFSTFTLQSVLHIYIFTVPTSSCDVFLTIITLSMVKDSFFVFRHTLSHFEKSCFRMHLLFMLTNLISNITPSIFRLYTKPLCLKKAWYIIDNLDVVKKRSKFLYSVSFENTEGGPLFCAPVKFQDYYQHANK